MNDQPAGPQPSARATLCAEAGYFSNLSGGRRGRATSSPPQFGHRPRSAFSAHATQNVHSNEQMRACSKSGAKSRPQHSQLGLSSSMVVSSPEHSNDEV
jgi:hypothetical protein